jgi:broad specificity polyphosphatase/5'/3'-nucleotidase SurE
VACQSTTGFHEYYIPQSTEDNTVYQLAGDLQHTDEASTDTVLLSEGYITITPLHADLTHHQGLAAVASKLDNIDFNT